MYDPWMKQEVGAGAFAAQAGRDLIMNGYPPHLHERLLKERETQVRQELKELYEVKLELSGTKVALLQKELEDIQYKMANSDSSYRERILFLEETVQALQALGGGVDEQLLTNAIAALQAGDTEQAEVLFAQAEDAEQEGVQRAAKAALGRGKIRREKWDLKDALKHFKRAIELSPDDIDCLRYGAEAACQLQDNALAMSWLERSIPLTEEISLYRAGIYNSIGFLLLSSDNSEESIKYFNFALSVCGKALGGSHIEAILATNGKGLYWLNKGSQGKARNSFFTAIRMISANPNGTFLLPIIYNNIGGIFATTKTKDNLQRAIRYFNYAKQLHVELFGEKSPGEANYNMNLGGAYISMKKYRKGLKFMEKAKDGYLRYYGQDYPQTQKILKLIKEFENKVSA